MSNNLIRSTKTKIIATVGPACNTREKLMELVKAGVDIFRLNFSHGTHESYLEIMNMIRSISEELEYPIAILQDLQGPKIRVETFEAPVLLQGGAEFQLVKEHIVGDETRASITYPEILDELEVGDQLMLNDGLITLEVTGCQLNGVTTEVRIGGMLSDHKGLNIPSRSLDSIPALTEKDLLDLNFGLEQRVDFLAISFVRKPQDIDLLEWEMSKHKLDQYERPGVIAKIEKPQAVKHIDGILAKVSGIMVARGDLGVEMDITMVPTVQRELINRANRKGKLVITATQMLESMTTNYMPTRAEVTDIANAVLDGTDAVMLSGETAAGKYPIHTVEIMNRTLQNTEDAIFAHANISRAKALHERNTTASIAEAVGVLTDSLPIKAIVCITTSGYTPRMLSKTRPTAPIIAYCHSENTRRKECLTWGTLGKIVDIFDDFYDVVKHIENDLLAHNHLKRGDMVIIVSGLPVGVATETNTIKIHQL